MRVFVRKWMTDREKCQNWKHIITGAKKCQIWNMGGDLIIPQLTVGINFAFNPTRNSCTSTPFSLFRWLLRILKTTRFFPRKFDGKDFPGYPGQSITLNSLERKLGTSEKRALRFINSLSLFIFMKASELKSIKSRSGKSINMPSTSFFPWQDDL